MSGYVLALDIGDKRIGVALASRIARLPAPLTVIERSAETDPSEAVVKLVQETDADTVVVGLPRDMKGQETEQTRIVRHLAKELEAKLSVPVVMQDEAVTSVMAEERLRDRGKAYTKGDIDAEAAAIILEDYLRTAVERSA